MVSSPLDLEQAVTVGSFNSWTKRNGVLMGISKAKMGRS